MGCIPFSKGSSWSRGQTRVSCIADRFFTNWATREAHEGHNWGQYCMWWENKFLSRLIFKKSRVLEEKKKGLGLLRRRKGSKALKEEKRTRQKGQTLSTFLRLSQYNNAQYNMLKDMFLLNKKWSEVKVTQSCPTLQPHWLYSPQNSLGQNTGVGSHSLLQGIFPTQGSNPGLPHCRQILYQLSYQGSPP